MVWFVTLYLKKTLIGNYSYNDINKIADWMNNYPRKTIDYKTPLETLIEELRDKTIINKIRTKKR